MTTNLGFLVFSTRGLVDGGRRRGRGGTHSKGFECVSGSHASHGLSERPLHVDQRTCRVHGDT